MVTIKMNSAHGDALDLGVDGCAVTIKLTVFDRGARTPRETETSMSPEKARLVAANLIEIAKQCESRRI